VCRIDLRVEQPDRAGSPPILAEADHRAVDLDLEAVALRHVVHNGHACGADVHDGSLLRPGCGLAYAQRFLGTLEMPDYLIRMAKRPTIVGRCSMHRPR